MEIKTIHKHTYKEFRVGDYFKGVRGKQKEKAQNLNKGETPLIAAARSNQGVAGYFDVPSKYKNAITVSCNGAGCGSTFYHDYPFAISGDAMVLENIGNVPESALRFIAIVYDVFLTKKYSYGDKCSPAKIEEDKIPLPVTSDGTPDWQYMHSYMENILNEANHNFQTLKKILDL